MPLDDRLLVLLDAEEDKTTAGGVILLAGDDAPKLREVTVLGVGAKVRAEIYANNRVLISAYAGTTSPDDDRARFVNEADVLAVVS